MDSRMDMVVKPSKMGIATKDNIKKESFMEKVI